MKAINFTLLDQDNVKHTLSDYLGKWVVVYFYPRDNTPGCTTEACSFQNRLTDYLENDIVVFGISANDIDSHKKFAKKYGLQYSLLSDTDLKVIKAYDSWGIKKFMGKEFEGILRKTFVINPEGEIVLDYPKVTPARHGEEILNEILKLQKKA